MGNKDKGYRFEREIADYLIEEFKDHPEVAAGIERHGTVYGVADRGDLRMGPIAWVWELKNVQRFDLAGFIRELEREISNHPDASAGAVVIKARMRSTGDAYSVMPLKQLVELLRENWSLKKMLRAERAMSRADLGKAA